ncbi:MAG: hydrogenase, partial [Nitrospirae bacterium]
MRSIKKQRADSNRAHNENIYLPFPGVVEEVVQKTHDVSLFRIKTQIPLRYNPGQFYMIGIWGAGEVPISIASLQKDPLNGGDGSSFIEFCVRKAGYVTSHIHALRPGDTLWLRGPYGNGFDLEITRNRDLVIVAGGIGIVPLRPVLQWVVENRDDLRSVTLLYGSRSPSDIVFRDEVPLWQKGGVKVVTTVDRGDENWDGPVGLVTTMWHEAKVDFKRAVALICGPEIMIKAAMQDLFFFGMPDDRIITTLEAHMKCGVGKCGHCYASEKYICTDGPVFSYREIKQ